MGRKLEMLVVIVAAMKLTGCHLIFPYTAGDPDGAADGPTSDRVFPPDVPPIFHDGQNPALDAGPAVPDLPPDLPVSEGGVIDVSPGVDIGVLADASPGPDLGCQVFITSVPATLAHVSKIYIYAAKASATGQVTWSLVLGPSGMTIDSASGLVTWMPSATGKVTVQLRATCGKSSTNQKYMVIVGF